MTGPIQKPMNQSCRVAVLAGVWAGIVLSARADPQVSGSASLTPVTLMAGETAVFAFTFSNSDAPESSAMTSSQLLVQWSLPVNGVATRFPLRSLNAAGGSAGFVFDRKLKDRQLLTRHPVPRQGRDRGFRRLPRQAR